MNISGGLWMRPLTFKVLLAFALFFSSNLYAGLYADVDRPAGHEEAWEEDAGKAFNLDKGLAGKLLLKEEWEEHKSRMEAMAPDELKEYRKEIHDSLIRRARRQGIKVPGHKASFGGDADNPALREASQVRISL
ncbi:MAG: hypothetical protein HY893_01485 [Deltaproteobacteria bacterium]|nr:hypothetical protein [Deltaproteobacteria bacterium]